MAQYFRVQRPNFQDYVVEPPEYLTDQRAATEGESAGGLMGDVKILPVDRPAYEQIIQPYEERINDITQRLQQNPQDRDRLQPQIDQLRRELYSEYRTGELANLRNRYEAYQQNVREPLSEIDDPEKRKFYEQRINLPSYSQDRTGRGIGITSERFAPAATRDEWQGFVSDVFDNVPRHAARVKDEVLRETPLEELVAVKEYNEILKPQANEHVMSLLAPDDIRRAQIEGEGNFYNPDTKEFNTDTERGRRLDRLSDMISGQTEELLKTAQLRKRSGSGDGSGFEGSGLQSDVNKMISLYTTKDSYRGGGNNPQEVVDTFDAIKEDTPSDSFLLGRAAGKSSANKALEYGLIYWTDDGPKVVRREAVDGIVEERDVYDVRDLTVHDLLRRFNTDDQWKALGLIRSRGLIDEEGNFDKQAAQKLMGQQPTQQQSTQQQGGWENLEEFLEEN